MIKIANSKLLEIFIQIFPTFLEPPPNQTQKQMLSYLRTTVILMKLLLYLLDMFKI